MKKKEKGEYSPSQKIEYAVHSESNLSRETIKEWMVKDMKGIQITLSEVLMSTECIEALTTIFYEKYLKLQQSKKESNETVNENVQ